MLNELIEVPHQIFSIDFSYMGSFLLFSIISLPSKYLIAVSDSTNDLCIRINLLRGNCSSNCIRVCLDIKRSPTFR
jgi:hypothetical protein